MDLLHFVLYPTPRPCPSPPHPPGTAFFLDPRFLCPAFFVLGPVPCSCPTQSLSNPQCTAFFLHRGGGTKGGWNDMVSGMPHFSFAFFVRIRQSGGGGIICLQVPRIPPTGVAPAAGGGAPAAPPGLQRPGPRRPHHPVDRFLQGDGVRGVRGAVGGRPPIQTQGLERWRWCCLDPPLGSLGGRASTAIRGIRGVSVQSFAMVA